MNTDQLQEHENEGRRLATVLLDHGFSPTLVRRSANELGSSKTRAEALYLMCRVNQDLACHGPSTAYQQAITKCARFAAFEAGVLAVLEERGL